MRPGQADLGVLDRGVELRMPSYGSTTTPEGCHRWPDGLRWRSYGLRCTGDVGWGRLLWKGDSMGDKCGTSGDALASGDAVEGVRGTAGGGNRCATYGADGVLDGCEAGASIHASIATLRFRKFGEEVRTGGARGRVVTAGPFSVFSC